MKKSATTVQGASSEAKERILVVSVDFDGCMGHTQYTKLYQEVERNNEGISVEEMNEARKSVILQANRALIEDVTARSQGYDRVVVMVGSNRQSANKDQHDAKKNQNGSCFRATEMLAGVLQENLPKQKVELDTFLIFDSVLGQEHGANFKMVDAQTRTQVFSDYEMSMDKKNRLAYFQMQEICARNPNAEVSYVHYDDRNDIVQDTVKAFQSERGSNLPPNVVQAVACHYELYNAVASMQSLASASGKQMELTPNAIVQKQEVNDFLAGLNGFRKEFEILQRLCEETKNKDHILDLKEKLNKLNSEKDQLKDIPEKKQEYHRKNLEISVLEGVLEQLDKPQKLLPQIDELIMLGKNSDTPLEWSRFNELVQQANRLFNNNIRVNNLKGHLPELCEAYAKELESSRVEMVREMGAFNRRFEGGHQIDRGVFDVVVRECMKDSIVNERFQSDPFSFFREVEAGIIPKARAKARECFDQIEQMLLKGHNLDPIIKIPGRNSQQQQFLVEYNGIKEKIAAGESPAQFLDKLNELKSQLEATKPNRIQAAQYRKYVTPEGEPLANAAEVSSEAKAPAVKWASSTQEQQAAEKSSIKFSRAVKAQTPAVDAPNPVGGGTLAGSMLRSSNRISSQIEFGPSEASPQLEEAAQKVNGLRVLSDSGPQAFEVTMNNIEGDFKTVVKDAKDAVGRDDVIEFDGNCVIKTENACIHLSKTENEEIKLSVHSQEDKQEKAFEDAARIVHGLGNMDCHKPDSLRDNTQKHDVQSNIEKLHAQRDSNLEY